MAEQGETAADGKDFVAGENEYANLGQPEETTLAPEAPEAPTESESQRKNREMLEGTKAYQEAFANSGANPDYAGFNGNNMGGKWLIVDGAPLAPGPDGDERFVESPYAPEVVADRVNRVGQYSVNGNVIAAIDGNGLSHQAPASESRISALQAAGYKEGAVDVVLSRESLKPGSYDLEQWKQLNAAEPRRAA